MGVHDVPWDAMRPCWSPWDVVGAHETPWSPVGQHETFWEPMAPVGTRWELTGRHGAPFEIPWGVTRPKGSPWDAMGAHGTVHGRVQNLTKLVPDFRGYGATSCGTTLLLSPCAKMKKIRVVLRVPATYPSGRL